MGRKRTQIDIQSHRKNRAFDMKGTQEAMKKDKELINHERKDSRNKRKRQLPYSKSTQVQEDFKGPLASIVSSV